MADEIGPWRDDSHILIPQRAPQACKLLKVRDSPRSVCRRLRTKDQKAPQSVQVSPVSFRSPDFKRFVPAHTWKPQTPVGVQRQRLRASPDQFGLYLVKASRPSTAAHASFDISIARQTLQRLVRATAKSPPNRDSAPCSHPSSGPLLKAIPVLPTSPLQVSQTTQVRPGRQYRRRVKDLASPKLSFPDYDQLAENLNEKLEGLIGKRPNTSARRKTPSQRESQKGHLHATLSQLIRAT